MLGLSPILPWFQVVLTSGCRVRPGSQFEWTILTQVYPYTDFAKDIQLSCDIFYIKNDRRALSYVCFITYVRLLLDVLQTSQGKRRKPASRPSSISLS